MRILGNVIWPSLYMAQHLHAWIVIAVSIAIESPIVLRATRAKPLRALVMTATMNAVSAQIGLIAIPLFGLLGDVVAWMPLNYFFGWGGFNPVGWSIDSILATLINTVVETATLKWVFRVPWSRRIFWWLAGANLATVGVAMLDMRFRGME